MTENILFPPPRETENCTRWTEHPQYKAHFMIEWNIWYPCVPQSCWHSSNANSKGHLMSADCFNNSWILGLIYFLKDYCSQNMHLFLNNFCHILYKDQQHHNITSKTFTEQLEKLYIWQTHFHFIAHFRLHTTNILYLFFYWLLGYYLFCLFSRRNQ